MKLTASLSLFYHYGETLQKFLEPIVLLAARVYIFQIFFFAGLVKLNDWESTLLLFEYEYAVPLLSPHFAAYLGTTTELVLPILILIGLFTSLSAIVLFIFNIVAVLSLAEMAHAALLSHVIWGGLIFSLIVWGAGKISLDNLITKIIRIHS